MFIYAHKFAVYIIIKAIFGSSMLEGVSHFCVRKSTFFLSLPQRGLLDNEKVHLPRGQHVVTRTTLDENNCDKSVGVSCNIAAKRRKLTYDAAKKIHSNPSSTEPEVQCATANGLWNTLVTNVKSKVVTDLLKR